VGRTWNSALGLNLMARSMSVSSTSSATCPKKDLSCSAGSKGAGAARGCAGAGAAPRCGKVPGV